jgi:hypothetical protein
MVALAAAALPVALAACATTATPPHQAIPARPGSPAAAQHPLPPRQAMLAAATQMRQLTSATELLTVNVSGSQLMTGTMRVQLQPTPLLGANLKLVAAGQSAHVKEILTSTAIYLSEASLTRQLGKPWVKINLSAMKGRTGTGFAQLFHSLQSNNFANQTQLLTVAKNASVAGTQTVDGVPTTEYAGSFDAAKALKALPAGFRKLLASGLQALGNSAVTFHAWIDSQHHIRKITEVAVVNGETINTTINITALNQPVHITLPPASQTAALPGSALPGA